jgi:hypothetical protein
MGGGAHERGATPKHPPQVQRLGLAVRHVIATMFGPVHSSHSAFDDLRELLFTSMRGVAVSYAISPRDPVTDPHLPLWQRTARQLLGIEG